MSYLYKFFVLFFVVLITLSCTESTQEKSIFPTKKKTEKHEDFNNYAKKHIKLQLRISNSEKFTYQIFKEHLDNDGKIDAIISVNRLDYALTEANKSLNPAKKAELGFIGNYNYIFYYDGGLDLISPPIAIPSSPIVPLNVEFKNICSENFKDILVDFRIRNASYKDIYTIVNHTPRRIFQWKNFDGIGDKNVEAYSIQFSAIGKYSMAKDILVYQGKIKFIPSNADLNSYEPKISTTKNLIHTFFYLEKEGKYFTKK